MVHKMRDLDHGDDYAFLEKKTNVLSNHDRFINAVKSKSSRSCCWPTVILLMVTCILFMILWVYYSSRARGIILFTFTELEIHEIESSRAVLVRIPAELANKNGAFCLDGTVPSYYIRKAKATGQHSWLVHLSGGGWCWDLNDCYSRSFSTFGSSKPRYLSPQRKLYGVLSGNPRVNPDFHDWNMIFVNYCDGAAFSGNMSNPVTYNDTDLYFRGSLILDLVINYLLQSGMKNAERIIFSGNSAGGSAVVLHIDHVKTLLPDGIQFHGLVDAGIFLDAKNLTNFDHFRVCTQRLYNIQQVFEGRLNVDCMDDQTADTRWKCFFAEYAYQYVKTPVFYINSAYDYWQLWFILEMHCHPTQCPDQLPFLSDFNKKYIELLHKMKNLSTKNGMYISSCYNHCQAYWNKPFLNHRVPKGVGKTPQEAIGDWYFERVPEGSSFHFDCENPYDCNPTCDWRLKRYNKKTDRWMHTLG